MLLSKGWLIHRPDGKPDSGGYQPVIGPNLDTTNPEAANWFWEKIRDRYVKPYGFDYIWLDETEPDVDPAKDLFFVGSGTRFYNVYPLFHTASVYDGFRRDFGDSRRVMILARAAYLGAQRNGTVFWSSDIISTLGHAQTLDSRGTEFYRDRTALLGHGHCGILFAVLWAGLPCSPQAADRRIGRARYDWQL